MDPPVKLIGYDRRFIISWNKLFRIFYLWICLYPALIIAAYEAYYWLRFAEFLDLSTYKTVPPRLLSGLYNFTNWEGVNLIIYRFLQLPIFITMPVVSCCFIFTLHQSGFAIYYLISDSRMLFKKFMGKFFK